MEEINEDRADHGKKPFDGTKATEEKAINESTTDPESGVFHKGEHKKCFAYTAQTGCDKNGYVMDVTVNSGNVHDSVAFDGLYERLIEKNPEIEAFALSYSYATSLRVNIDNVKRIIEVFLFEQSKLFHSDCQCFFGTT